MVDGMVWWHIDFETPEVVRRGILLSTELTTNLTFKNYQVEDAQIEVRVGTN